MVAEETDFIELYAAARLALDAEPDEREAAENDLTRQLQVATMTGQDPATRTRLASTCLPPNASRTDSGCTMTACSMPLSAPWTWRAGITHPY